MEKTFSISEALSFGWETTKKNIGFFIGVSLIAYVIPQLIISALSGGDPNSDIAGILDLIGTIYSMIVGIGVIVITLKLVRGEKPELADLFQHYKLFFNYLIGVLLYGLMVILGLILFIIPGVYLGLKYQFVSYFIVDKKMNPIDAFKASGEATQGNIWHLFGMYCIFIGLTILGALALVVGLFVTTPIIMLAYAYIYDQLSKDVALTGEVVTTTPAQKKAKKK